MVGGSPSPDGRRLLQACVGDLDRFLTEDVGRRPHLHRGSPDDDALAGLLTLDDVDELVTARSLRAPAFRLVRDGDTLPRSASTRTGRVGGVRVDDLPDPGRIVEHVRDGATLVLQALHRSWPPVTRLCQAIEDLLTHPVQANAYLTPPGHRGLDVHHDTHDVLAVQLAGTKHWVVHEPAVAAALPTQRWVRGEHVPGPVVLDEHLHCGDVLYLPRGTPHAAETTDAVSLHLTVGIRAVTWFDVLQRALADAADQERFRAALPPGFADDPDALAAALAPVLEDAGRWLAGQDADALARREATRFHDGRSPRLRGQLRRVLDLESVQGRSVVQRRADVRVRCAREADRVVLDLPDRRVHLPIAAAPAVEQLVAGGSVRVDSLDGGLDATSRVVLARRLVREGVLEVQPSGDEDG